MTTSTYEEHLERIEAGGRLTREAIADLSASPDILPLGMLADAVRRRLHGDRVTYVRVASCALDRSFGDAVPPAAREVAITGTPESLDVAASAIHSARAIAGDRTVTGFSWADVSRLAAGGLGATRVLEGLRAAGLDALLELPLDAIADPVQAIDSVVRAGFDRLRLTVDSGDAAPREALWLTAFELQDRFGCIQAIDPLPARLRTFRPTTGYEDVRAVALARLSAPNIAAVQVDWSRYGPKLAQVALTFGADDVWGISASDAAPEGRRRAPVEEIRRNVEAAGFHAVERDGRFVALA